MADNRMYLCCLMCACTEGTTREDCAQYFAKYYPSTGWYTKDGLLENIDLFLGKHGHRLQEAQHIALIYEDIYFAKNWKDLVRGISAPTNEELRDAVRRKLEEGKRRVEEVV